METQLAATGEIGGEANFCDFGKVRTVISVASI
jgi:hypothetical protein